jgi:ribosomal protein S18 acetylase RimI-like enzyme
MTHSRGTTGQDACGVAIGAADQSDREWAATVMAGSDPWITLGRNLESCRRVCLNADYQVFVAKRGEQRLGFALTHRRGVVGSPYLATLAVAAQHRGRGVGTHLLHFVEDHFRPDARHLFICVSSFNPRARQLYERIGFTPVGEIPDYFIDGASELLMYKRLR